MSESNRQAQAAARPRLGFLGVGWIGRHRMEAVIKSGRAAVTAIAEPAIESARQAAALAPEATMLRSLDELLDADIDGMVIATPSALHAEQAIAALERGIAVFCQKPLGRDATETRRVIDTARAAGRLLGVDLSYRFTEGMQRIRGLLRSGELGHIYGINLVFHNAYGPDKPWFYDRRLSGGGCVIDLGIHLVDLALWTLDFPQVIGVSSRLSAHGTPFKGRIDAVEDYAVAQFVLENGAAVQLACSWRLAAGCDAVIEVSFYGTRGGAAFRNVDGSFYDFVAERFHGTARETLATPPDQWGGRAAVDWACRLTGRGDFDPEIERLTNVAAAIDAIYGQR